MRSLQHVYFLKLAALRRLWVLLGFDREAPPPCDPIFLYALCCRFVDPDALPVQREAVAFLFDIYLPGWREHVSKEFLGYGIRRSDPQVGEWRDAVLSRDGYRCTSCHSEKDPHAHHVMRWIDAPHLRVVVDNGTTLCGECHRKVHAGWNA